MDTMGGGFFSVQVEEGRVLRARLSGKMRQNHIRVIPGDKVKVAVSPYDLTHGMITFRSKK